MAVSSRLSPRAVAALDVPDFLSLEAAAADRWGWSEELLATTCELLHHLIAVQLARGGVKPGKPLRIPRPGEPTRVERPSARPDAVRMSASGLRSMLRPGAEG